MKCTWIIQTNMSVSQTEEYTAACEELELPYVHFVQIPFTDELPELDIEFPYVFVGSTTVVELARKKYPYGVVEQRTQKQLEAKKARAEKKLKELEEALNKTKK